jgi:NAD(P)-dependent dehydrogenase (short-subunit alcohol dehydrogenase family)
MIQQELRGEVALVTGAAGAGIGQAIARRLAAGGANVVVTDSHERRTQEVTTSMASAFPDVTVVGYPLDMGDPAQIAEVVEAVTSALGAISILVNNAALNILKPIFELDLDEWRSVLAVNLDGPWYLSKLVMTGLRDASRGGAIVNISSYAPDIGGEGRESPYAVSKGGLNTLTRCCAHEGGPLGIRVNAVSMGIVTGTKFIDAHPELLELPGAAGVLGHLANAEEIAETVAFLTSDRARSLTGEILNVSAGAYMRN